MPLESRAEAKKLIKEATKDVVGDLGEGVDKDPADPSSAASTSSLSVSAFSKSSSDREEGGIEGGGGGDALLLGVDGESGGEDFDEGTIIGGGGRAEMSPTDVIDAALAALKENDFPSPNNGINVLLSYMSDASSFGEVRDPSLFEEYIPSGAYSVLVNWSAMDFPKKLEVSLDGTKAYQIVRLRDKRVNEWKKVKWTLSKRSDIWCIDNVLVMTSRR